MVKWRYRPHITLSKNKYVIFIQVSLNSIYLLVVTINEDSSRLFISHDIFKTLNFSWKMLFFQTLIETYIFGSYL